MAQSFQVSLPAQAQGVDVAAEQEEIARRRRMADMLRQQSAQPEGQMVSGRFVAPSLTQRLAGLFNAYQSGQIDRQASEQARSLGQRTREAQQGDIDSVLSALQGGQRGVEGMPDETGNPIVQMEQVPGDRSEAMRRALRSSSPIAQQIGGTLLSQALKPPAQIEWKLGERFNEQTGRPEKFMYNPANPQQTMPVGGQQATRLEFQNTGPQIVGVNPYTGERAGPAIDRGMTPGESGRLAWDQYQWSNISPEQRERLRQGAASNAIAAGNLGVAQSNLLFNTGMASGGGAGAGRMNLPPNAPMPAIGGPQAAPQPMPQVAPQAAPQGGARPPVTAPAPSVQPGQLPRPGVIGQPPAQVPGPASGLTPKQQADMLKDQIERRANAERTAPAIVAQIGTVVGAIDNALGRATGVNTGLIGAARGMIPGTSAYDLRNDVTTIKANLGFSELQKMREASPTGGALGQVAVQELEALQSTVRSINPNQSRETIVANLEKVRNHYTKWAEAVAQANGITLPPDLRARGRVGGGGDLASQAAAELARRQREQ
jgi:hypothetical protein